MAGVANAQQPLDTYLPHPDDAKRERLRFGMMVAGTTCGFCVLIFVVAGVVLLFTGGQSFVQDALEQGGMTFDSMEVIAFREDGFRFNITGSIYNAAPVYTTMGDTTLAMCFGTRWRTLGLLRIPHQVLKPGKNAINLVNQNFDIEDRDTFYMFTQHLLTEKDVWVQLQGRTSIKIKSLLLQDLFVNFSTSLTGFNQFRSDLIQVCSINLTGSDKSALYASMHIELNNPSTFCMPIGHLALDLWYKDSRGVDVWIGSAMSADTVFLRGGLSCIDLNATFERTSENAEAVDEFLSLYLSGELINFTAKGRATEDTPDELKVPIQQLSTVVTIPLLPADTRMPFRTSYFPIDVSDLSKTKPDDCDLSPLEGIVPGVRAYFRIHNILGLNLAINSSKFNLTWLGDCPSETPTHKPMQVFAASVENFMVEACSGTDHDTLLDVNLTVINQSNAKQLAVCLQKRADMLSNAGNMQPPFSLHWSISGNLNVQIGDFPGFPAELTISQNNLETLHSLVAPPPLTTTTTTTTKTTKTTTTTKTTKTTTTKTTKTTTTTKTTKTPKTTTTSQPSVTAEVRATTTETLADLGSDFV